MAVAVAEVPVVPGVEVPEAEPMQAHKPMVKATERGSGTVLMLVLMTMAGFLIMVTLLLASAIVARHRAGAIADLSALAAASGPPGAEACDRARRVAGANAGRLVRCQILGDGSVLVDVEWAAAGGLPGIAHGSARAGPAPN